MRQQIIMRAIAKATAVIGVSVALMAPAAAQFWNPFGGSQQRFQRQPPPRQQPYNPFGGWWGGAPREPRQHRTPRSHPKPAITDSQAPPPPRRSAEAATAVTSPIVVLGDGMADWLGYGLVDAFADRPEFGIVRKHRAFSGLVRYDPRRDVEWPQIARELIAAERPKFIVMMVGFHDHQVIRERAPSPATPGRSKAPSPAPEDDPEFQDPDSPESRARASADQQNAEMQKAAQPPAAPATPKAAPAGPMEFQSEEWQAAYIRRIDATMAALKSANVPVIWVGLPPQRNPRQAADAVFLNELYRARAERAGITFVDVWDGFVDEAGRYVLQGPDVEGQIRRLRSGDGIYFTRAGARKLAHYVEREILRNLLNREMPVALPVPEPALPQQGKSARPLVGPVIPLTATIGGGTELLGGGSRQTTGFDALTSRVLVRGEAISAPAGRADNFVWPRGGSAPSQEVESAAPEPASVTLEPAPRAATTRPSRGTARQPEQNPDSTPQRPVAKRPVQRRIPPRASNDGVPRPPLPIAPSIR
jgi:hypothetical protein